MKRSGADRPGLVRRLLGLLLPPSEREFYLGDLEESGRRAGLREVAGAAALRVASVRGRGLGAGGNGIAPLLSAAATDARLGFRRLLRTPAVTLTVLTALSVGIGLSGLMFSLIDSALLPTLPFEAGERIVRVQRSDFGPVTPATYADWQAQQRSFEGLSAWVGRPVNLTIDGAGSAQVESAAVDAAMLSLLSVRPVLGRGFAKSDAAPGAPAVVLVGHEVWRTRMGADPGAVGRIVRVNGQPAEVVGVLPEGFGFPWNQELWTPLRLDPLRPELDPGGVGVFGVLREGVDAGVAIRELNELDRRRPRPRAEAEGAPVDVVPFTDIISPRGRSALLAGIMLSVALLVLLVACANAANVLLSQAVVRRREVAIRSALGASPARVAAQFWIEVSTLAIVAAAVGAALAVAGVRLIDGAVPTGIGMPFWFDLRVDLAVLVFVAGVAVLAALLAGVAPAIHAARTRGGVLLADGARGSSSRRLGRIMGRLTGVEMAVSLVLLVAAGLFIRSVVNLQRWEFTFEPEGVYGALVRLPDGRYDDAQARDAVLVRLEESLAAIPGATSAALATALPGIWAPRGAVAIEGIHDPASASLPDARTIAASSGFFETFRAPVLAGRGFGAADRDSELPVAIVNRAFERAYLPAGAVGRRVAFPSDDGAVEWITVVGVVPDLLAGGLERQVEEAVYRPFTREAPAGFHLVVRADVDAAALAAPVREAVAAVDRDIALSFANTLDRSIDAANASHAWLSALFLVAGLLALFLAAIGLYGVMAFWVAQRTREIGVRMALGGGRREIVGLVLRQAMTQTVRGWAAGLVLAATTAWLLRGALLDVQPWDPIVFATAIFVLGAAAWLGCLVPALRATRVDPQTALAAE